MFNYENYSSFAVVCGFFVGIVLSLMKYNDPEMILFWTIMIMMGFYIISLLAISAYINFKDYEDVTVNKSNHEKIINYYIDKISEKEKYLHGDK